MKFFSTFSQKYLEVIKKAVSLQRFREIKRTKNKFKGRLAQLVQSICLTSRGSAVRIRQRPPLNLLFHRKNFGRLAQLVQSICLTSRGSAVRIRQRPQKIESVNLMINRLFYLSSTAHSRLLLLSRQRNSYQTI